MQAFGILYFLIFSKFVSGISDKIHFSTILDIGPHNEFTFFISEAILLVGLKDCVENCKATKGCKYINYDRPATVCYFIGVQGGDDPTVTNSLVQRKGHIFGDKSEWNLGKYNVCSECEEHGSCMRDNFQNEKFSICRNSGCGPPPISNGSIIHGNMYSAGNKVLYECESGYVLTNSEISKCLDNGTWSLKALPCLRDCGSLPPLSNGDVSLDSTTTTSGSTATVSCHSGYEAEKNSISCEASGSWEVPTCTQLQIDCGDVPLIENGVVSYSFTTTVGATVRVNCNRCYNSDKDQIKCLNNGSWEIPTCSLSFENTLKELGGKYTILTANETLQFITSPNYPAYYENYETEHWLIVKPSGTLSLDFTDVDFELNQCYDNLQIFPSEWSCSGTFLVGHTVCSDSHTQTSIWNWSPSVLITFTNGSNDTNKRFKIGFHIEYRTYGGD